MKRNTRKQKKQIHTKFPQSFQVTSDGQKKWLKTDGEEGFYMIDIRVTDCRDIRTVHSDDWWQKTNKKAVFVTQSSKDPLYMSVMNILKQVLNKIKTVPNVKSGAFSLGNNKRFKPY